MKYVACVCVVKSFEANVRCLCRVLKKGLKFNLHTELRTPTPQSLTQSEKIWHKKDTYTLYLGLRWAIKRDCAIKQTQGLRFEIRYCIY